MSNLYRGPSIDAPYQISVHLAEGFQRRRLKCEKLRMTDNGRQDDGRQTTDDGCQGELKMVNFKIEHGNHFLWRHIEWLIGTK